MDPTRGGGSRGTGDGGNARGGRAARGFRPGRGTQAAVRKGLGVCGEGSGGSAGP